MSTLNPVTIGRLTPASGIPIALYGSDPDYLFEIERAPDSAGAPDTGSAVPIADEVLGTDQIYIDALPLDGVQRWYRIRHIGNGDTPSAWTEWVAATPVSLPSSITRPAPTAAVIVPTPSASGTTATLDLTVTDPQSRVTQVEFQTTVGGGSPSGWSTDTSPYSASVTIAAPLSLIEYRVTGYDANGVLGIVAQSSAGFLATEGPTLDVIPTESTTSTSLAYTSNGVAEYRVDAGAWLSATSPLFFSRNAAGGAAKNIQIRATLNGQTISAGPFSVPPQDASPPSRSFTGIGAFVLDYSLDQIEIDWTVTGFVAGDYYRLMRQRNGGGYSQVDTGITATFYDDTVADDIESSGGGPNVTFDYQVEWYDVANALQLTSTVATVISDTA